MRFRDNNQLRKTTGFYNYGMVHAKSELDGFVPPIARNCRTPEMESHPDHFRQIISITTGFGSNFDRYPGVVLRRERRDVSVELARSGVSVYERVGGRVVSSICAVVLTHHEIYLAKLGELRARITRRNEIVAVRKIDLNLEFRSPLCRIYASVTAVTPSDVVKMRETPPDSKRIVIAVSELNPLARDASYTYELSSDPNSGELGLYLEAFRKRMDDLTKQYSPWHLEPIAPLPEIEVPFHESI
ncbi:hypothetical protein HY990_05980 [Candidatus Micrarchaeota archaeon]|nr:hypothetical protein [Candidatus Micrarchaeota archaeon]